MRIKETKLYTYAELSDDAKAKARDWYRESANTDFADFGADGVTDDFCVTLKALGFDVNTRPVTLMSGKTRRDPCIYWSGFWSQGDGASFSGTWRASDCNPEKLLANRPEVYATENGENAKSAENVELHRIASEILAVKSAGATWGAIEIHRSSHFMTCSELEWSEENTPDDLDALQESFAEAARDLAHAFYKALESEYDYQNSDEQVAEAIIANEYEFTEEGERA